MEAVEAREWLDSRGPDALAEHSPAPEPPRELRWVARFSEKRPTRDLLIMTSCAKLWPPNDPVRASRHWDHLAGVLLKRHGMVSEAGGYALERPLLIGIRGAAPGDQETHELHARPAYDDGFVLVQKNTMPMLFRGATHAYQVASRAAPDEDGDGRGDVGSIRPGRYVLTDTDSQPSPIFNVANPDGTTRIRCWRDL